MYIYHTLYDNNLIYLKIYLKLFLIVFYMNVFKKETLLKAAIWSISIFFTSPI